MFTRYSTPRGRRLVLHLPRLPFLCPLQVSPFALHPPVAFSPCSFPTHGCHRVSSHTHTHTPVPLLFDRMKTQPLREKRASYSPRHFRTYLSRIPEAESLDCRFLSALSATSGDYAAGNGSMVRPEVGGGVAGGGQSERRRQSKEQREAWHVVRRYLPKREKLNY